jgi:hypothetical protein
LGGKKLSKNIVFNLVSLKPSQSAGMPSFFDDTIQVVEALIRGANFPVYRTTNQIAVDAINIVWGVGTHLFPNIDAFRAAATPRNTVVFNMEQLASGSALVSESYLSLLGDYVVLDYNQANIDVLKSTLNREVLAYEFPLRPIMDMSPFNGLVRAVDCDCVFFGALSADRIKKIDRLAKQGLKVRVVGGFGAELSEQILRSKFVLNIHLHSSAIFEVARVMRPLSHGVPVLSEISVMPRTVSWEESGVLFCDETSFVDKCLNLASSATEIIQQSRNALRFSSISGAVSGVDGLLREIVAVVR